MKKSGFMNEQRCARFVRWMVGTNTSVSSSVGSEQVQQLLHTRRAHSTSEGIVGFTKKGKFSFNISPLNFNVQKIMNHADLIRILLSVWTPPNKLALFCPKSQHATAVDSHPPTQTIYCNVLLPLKIPRETRSFTAHLPRLYEGQAHGRSERLNVHIFIAMI